MSGTGQSGTGMKNSADAADCTKIRGPSFGTGILRYRTEMLDAGIPMPAASTSMPMTRFAK